MVLTACFVLFPETGFVASVIGAMRKHRRQLGVSIGTPEPHDFTVRLARARLSREGVHRSPPLTLVTIAKRPSSKGGMSRFDCCVYQGVKRSFWKSEIGITLAAGSIALAEREQQKGLP